MTHSPRMQDIFTYWVTPLFTGVVLYLLGTNTAFPTSLLWMGLMLPERMYGHREPTAETSILLLPYFILKHTGYTDLVALYFPLMVAVLLWAVWKSRFPGMTGLYHALILVWMGWAGWRLAHAPAVLGWLVWIAVLTAWWMVIITRRNRPGTSSMKNIDVILCSFSGHTADYTQAFLQGAEAQGAACTIHRFHYSDQFAPQLTGDALVLAFPVSGWKPPWTVVAYLWKSLPQGMGKPAFILYTAMGGPENAGFVAWWLLTMKGYRVCGSQWAFYPNNVVTLRIGLNAFWKWLDRLVPFKETLAHTQQAGADFVQNRRTGHPVFFWPFPLLFAGALLDNRWVNIAMYRNYVWKSRCIRCGLCIRHCPTKRLDWHKGFPKAKGTCALCMGCVNLCPKRAMQVFGWTEYGHAYHSRWPGNIIKSPDDARLHSPKEDAQ